MFQQSQIHLRFSSHSERNSSEEQFQRSPLWLNAFQEFFFVCFLSGFFFTNIYDSRDTKRKGSPFLTPLHYFHSLQRHWQINRIIFSYGSWSGRWELTICKEPLRNILSNVYFRYISMKCISEISFQKCLLGIIGTSLTNIAKVAFPREIRKRKFLGGSPFKSKVCTCARLSYLRRTQVYTPKYRHLSGPRLSEIVIYIYIMSSFM